MIPVREAAVALFGVAGFLCIVLFAAFVMAKKDLDAGIVVVIGLAISSAFWGAMLMACGTLFG